MYLYNTKNNNNINNNNKKKITINYNMYFKINLQILIVIFLIISIFLILFKNNLRSESQYLNNETFGNIIYVNSSGNTVSGTTSNNGPNILITYQVNPPNTLTGLNVKDGSYTTIYPRYFKLPLIYMFDPSGFSSEKQVASYYNTSSSAGYSLFNTVTESVLLNTPARGITIGNYQTPLTTFPTTYNTMPKNLFNLKRWLGGSDTDTSTTATSGAAGSGLTVLRQAPANVGDLYINIALTTVSGSGNLTTDSIKPGLITYSNGSSTYYDDNSTFCTTVISGSTLGAISTPLMRNRNYILGFANILNIFNDANTYIKYKYTTFRYIDVTVTTSATFNTANGIT